LNRELIEGLRKSRSVLGELYPVLVDDETGEVLAGRHRSEAGWESRRLVSVRRVAERLGLDPSRPEVRYLCRLLIDLHSNWQRKPSKDETARKLLSLAKTLEDMGVPRERVCARVAELVPYDESYVRRLLPDEYKMESKTRIQKKPEEELKPENKLESNLISDKTKAGLVSETEPGSQRFAGLVPQISHEFPTFTEHEDEAVSPEAVADWLLSEAKREVFQGWGRVLVSDFAVEHRLTEWDVERAVEELRRRGYEVEVAGGVVRVYLAEPAKPKPAAEASVKSSVEEAVRRLLAVYPDSVVSEAIYYSLGLPRMLTLQKARKAVYVYLDELMRVVGRFKCPYCGRELRFPFRDEVAEAVRRKVGC